MVLYYFLQVSGKIFIHYLLYLLLGFFSYYLKYFSFSSVVQKIPSDQFPIVLLIMGIISFASVKLSLNFFSKLKHNTVFLVLFVLALFCNPAFYDRLPTHLVFTYLLFILSLIGSSIFQTYFVANILNKDRIQDPLRNTKILLTEEIGTLVAAFVTLKFHFGLYSLPIAFIFALIILYSPKPEFKAKSDRVEMKSFYPFGETLIYVFIALMLCKVFYSYLFIESLKTVQSSQGGGNFLEIFAKFSSLEASISIILLLMRSFGWLNVSWPRAFKGFFILTFLMMIGLAFTYNFYLGLLACGLSKVWQKVVMKDSTHNIFHSLPVKVRLYYWAESEKNSYLIGYITLVLVSICIIFFNLDKISIAFSMIIFSILGFFLVLKLINTITQFHIANMARSDSKGSYVSCLALLVLKSDEHKSALVTMLYKTDDNRLKKAIIYVLGHIRSEDSIKTLIDYYNLSKDKEDIQLAIVTSLIKFKSHEVDFFLLESLLEIINKQTSLGEIRRSLFLKITQRLKDIAIPSILRVLNNQEDHRIIANALIVLGEIGLSRGDKDVLAFMKQYLDQKFSRRIRSNAILYLFKMNKFKKIAYGVFEEFLTSREDNDKAAAAFLAGELELTGITPFIWENSVAVNHSNPTLLFSLLKLNFIGTEQLIINFILTADTEKSLLAINQLSSINKNFTRFKVYQELLTRDVSSIESFIELMKKCGRDFDDDLTILEEELEILHSTYTVTNSET